MLENYRTHWRNSFNIRCCFRTSIGGIHSGEMLNGARRSRPRTSPLASECHATRSSGHNRPASELVKRRIRWPIIYFNTIHVRRPVLGRSAGVNPEASIVVQRLIITDCTIAHAYHIICGNCYFNTTRNNKVVVLCISYAQICTQ